MATDREMAHHHLLNGETAEGLALARHDDEPPQATPTYMLVMSLGWADEIIAERMSLDHARGIGHALADVLDCIFDPEPYHPDEAPPIPRRGSEAVSPHPSSPHPPGGLPGVVKPLGIPLVVQYVVFAPIVCVIALAAGAYSACRIAWETACDAYAAIKEAHAWRPPGEGTGS